MDIQMPVMDGHTATKEIRQDPAFADLPIIAMTANVMAADCQRCFDAGMNDHVAKPVDPDKLFQALVRWIPAQEEKWVDATVPPTAIEESLLPASLPGINLVTGLRRTSGSSQLLRKLLRQFHKDHRQDVQIIRKALDAGDIETAQRISHTLKGVTGTIGAETLYQAASALDKGISSDNAEEIPALLEQLKENLLEVLQGLESLDDDPVISSAQETTGECDMETVFSLLAEIGGMLHKFDPDAEEKATTLMQLLSGTAHHKVSMYLLNQIEATEFDAAGETLQLLQSELRFHNIEQETDEQL